MTTPASDMLLLYPGLRYRTEASSDDWARVVRAFPVFVGIGRRRLRKLCRHASFLEFAVNETVINRWDIYDSIYVVLGGTATARRPSGAQTLRVGDHFGGMTGDERDRVTTVVAADLLHVMRLPRTAFDRRSRRRRAISFARIRKVAAVARSEPSCASGTP